MNNSGNVGIGTTDPGAKLEVAGDVKTNGSIYYGSLKDWKLVYRDDFESSASGWSMTTRTACNSANMLGGYNTTAGTSFNKSFDLSSFPHTDVKVELDYYAIDSWDGEIAYVYLSGSNVNKIWKLNISGGDSGRINVCGNASYSDGVYHAELSGTHTANTVTVYAGSTLDQAANDESFGIDNVEIWVR